jgi:hypothetical protein
VFGLPPGEYDVFANFAMAGAGYVPTYYPGTALRGEAQRIAIKAGEELGGVTFALIRAHTASVSGVVRKPDGTAGVLVVVTASETSGGHTTPGSEGMAIVRPDSTFTIGNLPPGSYALDARTMDRPNASTARTEVVVNGRDVDGVILEFRAGVTARGRIAFETGALPQGLSPEHVRVISTADEQHELHMTGMPAAARADWTFELTGISGPRLLNAMVLRDGWAVKAVRLDGEDVTDTPIDFRTDVDGLEIVLTQQVTELSGRVTDGRRRPMTDAVVIVFVDDPDKRRRPRYLMTARPDQDGRFQMRGLRPASYIAVAVEDIEPGEESNPELLEQLTPRGTRLTLRDGESRAVDLTVSTF